MALYSFAIQEKSTGTYVRDCVNHELEFLDFLTMQFNNMNDLIRFLGLVPENVGDIAIAYNSEHKQKLLPIYFDAPELKTIAGSMLNIPYEEFESMDEFLAVCYTHPEKLQFNKIPEKGAAADVVDRILIKMRICDTLSNENLPLKALQTGFLHRQAYDSLGSAKEFRGKMTETYLPMRKAYMFLRNEGYYYGTPQDNQRHFLKLSQLTGRYKARHPELRPVVLTSKPAEIEIPASVGDYDINPVVLTSEEEALLMRANSGDYDAYEQLMGSDIDRLESLKPFMKKIG